MRSKDLTEKACHEIFRQWKRQITLANGIYREKSFVKALEIYNSLLLDCYQYLIDFQKTEREKDSATILKLLECYLITSDNIAEYYQQSGQIILQVKRHKESLNLINKIITQYNVAQLYSKELLNIFSRTHFNYMNATKDINSKFTSKILKEN